MHMISRIRGDRQAWTINRYSVEVSNPLRLRDRDFSSDAGIEYALIEAGLMQPTELPITRKLFGADFLGWVRGRIEDAGYDSVIYRNNVEDAGSDSYVIWCMECVKPAPPRLPRRSGR